MAYLLYLSSAAAQRLESGLLWFPGFPFCGTPSASLALMPRSLAVSRSHQGLPSSWRFSLARPVRRIPRSLWTPADPPSTHHNALFVLASGPLTPSPSACWDLRPCALTRLYQDFGECGLPCGLRGSLYTPQPFRWVILLPPSITFLAVATLSMGGWLVLTQRGLSPLKKRQASLGAPTTRA